MAWAYLDSNGYVRATSKVARTLAQAKKKDPAVTQVVVNAPGGLRRWHDKKDSQVHRKLSGDGTQRFHYALVANPNHVPDTQGDLAGYRIQGTDLDIALKGIAAYLATFGATSGANYDDLMQVIKDGA